MTWLEDFAYRIAATIILVLVFWNVFGLVPGIKSLELLGVQIVLPLSVIPAVGIVELLRARGQDDPE
ncbi:MAG: hypothetical protein AAF494_00505 [Pseudomonadota bacterium]